jgi:hypothetical protein
MGNKPAAGYPAADMIVVFQTRLSAFNYPI